MKTLEVWPFCAGCSRPQTEVSSSNKLVDPLDIEIFKL